VSVSGSEQHPSEVPEGASESSSNRADARYPSDAVPEITGLRVSPGDRATLVNISASGLLMESATRFAPGLTVTVFFEGTLATPQIKARIVRCQVSAIDKGTLKYQTALAFEHRLALPIEAAAAPSTMSAAAGQPADRDAGTTTSQPENPSEPPRVFNRW
jgi:hypothetical protein